MRLKWPRFHQVRDAALLVGGLALLAHETVLAPEPRIALITIAAGMIGLPATFLADRRFGGSTPSPPGRPELTSVASSEPESG